jgi:putative toxin-antitoxin system antitoxin component (TIGR02293 family)
MLLSHMAHMEPAVSSHAAVAESRRSAWVRFGLQARPAVAVSRIARLSPIERIALVREGVPADFVVKLIDAMRQPKTRVLDTVRLPRSTVARKAARHQKLSSAEGERVLGLAALIGLAQRIVEESGEPEGFDAAMWVGAWLNEPHPALGGRTPGEYFDTAEGRALVADLLARQQSGAYA